MFLKYECDGQFVDSLQQVTLGDSHDVPLGLAAHEVVLCAMAMWFESSCSAARTAANGSEVGEIVAPPFPSGTLGMRWPLLLDLEPTRSGSCSPCSHKWGVGCPKLKKIKKK